MQPRASLPVRLARALAAVLSLLVLAGSGYGWYAYRTLGSSVTQIAGPGSSGASAEQNVLLVGDDHRPEGASPEVLAELSTGEVDGAVNTDTMMLLHVPAGGGRATVISLPRDSWVDIPGVGKGKLNSAFAAGAANGGGDAGGMALLIRTVQDLTGLHVDHFVRVSLLGFYQVAQVLGPVQVCLNQPASDPYSGTDLPAGVSTLDAKQALSFVRQRHGLPRGDLDRVVRQQYFLSTELRKATSSGVLLDPAKLRRLLQAVGSAVQTDPGLDLLQFAEQFAAIASGDVAFTTIPTLGTPTIRDDSGNAVSVVAVDRAALPAFVAEVVGEPAAYVDAPAAAPAAVDVQVVNGTDTAGLATQQADALRGLGFPASVADTGTTSSLTTVTYPPGTEAQAKAVAEAVPGVAVGASSDVDRVTLTLGTDGRTVAPAGSAGSTAPAASLSPSAPSPAASSSPSPVGSDGLTSTFSASSCVN
ncbi:LytR family transcriptional regulator [Geodermatophilus sp. TF02-6]|uniref:LCP family protein n=1 Tax=Geodermatophilus sp. TF02-6 TaxID=2250575 RepID=UPI000DE84472|nr:LCP family protein [Geodermatophilus sp. TF02-6]RBY79582.1 LytR family transcriptional regulator [Geodermatophilus sp. TF02-6]